MRIRPNSRSKVMLKGQTIPNLSAQKKNYRLKKKDNRKIAKTRRQRGYHWEDTIVKRFNLLPDWKAFRLGSASTKLPDVLVVSTKNNSIFTIEAKSGTVNTLFVPHDQITRCLKWFNTFELYKNRKVIFAFKFLSKKRIGLGKYESRELREFFKVWDESKEVCDCVCTYDGKTYALINGKRSKLDLKEYPLPFQ